MVVAGWAEVDVEELDVFNVVVLVVLVVIVVVVVVLILVVVVEVFVVLEVVGAWATEAFKFLQDRAGKPVGTFLEAVGCSLGAGAVCYLRLFYNIEMLFNYLIVEFVRFSSYNYFITLIN